MAIDHGRALGAPRRRRLRGTFAAALLVTSTPAGAQVMDRQVHAFALFERLEYAPGLPRDPVALDALGWVGGDVNRVWLRAEGDVLTARSGGELEAEVLYGRLVAPYWDALAGARVETVWDDESETRLLLAIGLVGLAPYWFELEPTLFVSQDGDVSAQLEVEYELLFTQRLVLQPRLDVTAAVQDVPEFGVGSGLNGLDLGARLRYEIRREFAPYVGVTWTRRTFETADLARAAGEPVSRVSFLAGVRAWY